MSNDHLRKASSTAAFITFFKSLFGAGVLALPNVIGEVRLVIGCVTYLAITAGCAGTCYLLLKAREIAMEHIVNVEKPTTQGSRKRLKRKCSDYDDFGEQQYENGSGTHDEEFGRRNDQQAEKPHLVTYGDLASVLLNPFMADLTRWTIIILNFLFTSGLVIVICESISSVFESTISRHDVGMMLLPVIAIMVQLPWLQDMFFLSFLGLIVYGVGVMGSTFYSSFLYIKDPETSPPDDMWELEWSKIPSFLGSAVYALEGINLALPTVYSMEHPDQGITVVCFSLLLYGVLTVTFAAIGYAGGLGGESCDVVTQCIHPAWLKDVIQIALSIAMILGIPIMLYPTTEMLEVMLTDWRRSRKKENLVIGTQKENLLEISLHEFPKRDYSSTIPQSPDIDRKNVTLLSIATDAQKKRLLEVSLHEYSKRNYASTGPQSTSNDAKNVIGSKSKEHSGDDFHTENNATDEYVHEKSTTLRFLLAFLTVLVGIFTPSFSLFSAFVGAIGLTFAGFVLPSLIYIRAMQKANQEISWSMKLFLFILIVFGVWNMVVGGYKSGVELFGSLL